MKLFNIESTLMDERVIWLVFLITISLFSCNNMSNTDDDYSGITGIIEELPQLPDPFEYKMWIFENSNTRLVTTFNSGDDRMFRLAAAPQSQIIADANEILVTIEDSNEIVTKPGENEIVGARFTSNDQSDVKTYPIAADFSGVSGSILFSDDSSNQIISFEESEESLFNLPNLKDGWRYTFWIEVQGEESELFTFYEVDDISFYSTSLDYVGAKLRLGVESELLNYSYGSLGMYILELTIEDTEEVQEMTTTLEKLPTGTITKER